MVLKKEYECWISKEWASGPNCLTPSRIWDSKRPMPIQAAALPELLDGRRDFIGLAQTGTGKTGAFGLPLLQRVDTANPHPRARAVPDP